MNNKRSILKRLSYLWPFVLKKRYLQDMGNILTTLRGLVQAEAQHSQIEMNILKNMNTVNASKQNATESTSSDDNNDDNVSYQ